MEEKNYLNAGLLGEDEFFQFLARIRIEKNVGLEELSEGICSASQLARMEKGEREAGLLLQERILARMGIADDGYETFLMPDEYDKWDKRRKIMQMLDSKKMLEAERLVKEYQKEHTEDAIEEQFGLTMSAYVLRMEGKFPERTAKMFEQALKRTVPSIDSKRLSELCLSLQELNLVLEYTFYCKPECMETRCGEILDYLREHEVDRPSRVKFQPKVLYYLCRALPQETIKDIEERVILCREGIELLREEGKLYYLYELLLLQEEQTGRLSEMWRKRGEMRLSYMLTEEKKEAMEWRKLLGKLYDTYDVSARMLHDCHLYQKQKVHSISEVIRLRREMFHMTKRKLCEGICSEKVLGRLEANKTRHPQKTIVNALFERLHIAKGYKRTEIITDNREVLCMARDMCRALNDREYGEAEQYLDQIKSSDIKDYIANRQYIEDYEALIAFRQGKINREAYIKKVQEVLGYTLPQAIVLQDGEKYFTDREAECIYHIATGMGTHQINEYYEVLLHLQEQYEQKDKVEIMIGTYEWVMNAVSSVLGNMGEFDQSDAVSQKLFPKVLQSRRLHELHSIQYNLVWNEKERHKLGIPVKKEMALKEGLQECLNLSRLYKRTCYVQFYMKILQSYEKWKSD